jgi:hypothetical protein
VITWKRLGAGLHEGRRDDGVVFTVRKDYRPGVEFWKLTRGRTVIGHPFTTLAAAKITAAAER